MTIPTLRRALPGVSPFAVVGFEVESVRIVAGCVRGCHRVVPGPVPVIQQQLGHTSLATTDRYLRHLAPKDVVEAMRQREWAL